MYPLSAVGSRANRRSQGQGIARPAAVAIGRDHGHFPERSQCVGKTPQSRRQVTVVVADQNPHGDVRALIVGYSCAEGNTFMSRDLRVRPGTVSPGGVRWPGRTILDRASSTSRAERAASSVRVTRIRHSILGEPGPPIPIQPLPVHRSAIRCRRRAPNRGVGRYPTDTRAISGVMFRRLNGAADPNGVHPPGRGTPALPRPARPSAIMGDPGSGRPGSP